MNNLSEFCVITIVLAFLITFVSLTVMIVYLNDKHRKKLEEITMYQIHVSSQIDTSIQDVLNMIIQESFTDYLVKYLVPLEEGYINSEREAEIRRDLVNLVTRRISNAVLDKLSLFYNIENIADILADKIYIIIMNYVIEHNNNLGK